VHNAPLDDAIEREAARLFADHVMHEAKLPPQRRRDVEDAPEFHVSDDGALECTCTITGATYRHEHWNGESEAVLALSLEAADGTAYLVTSTPHYAWLRSRRE
jgi:hypothetical protein